MDRPIFGLKLIGVESPARLSGALGEAQAVRHLRGCGMIVLGRNVRLGHDEIDVVAFDPLDRVVAFVEVKTRAHGEQYRPELNMTSKKRSRMLRAARRWVGDHGYDGGYRLDAVYVSGPHVQHIRDLEPTT